MLLASRALTLLDLSSNVIQAFSDVELLPLDCLDTQEVKDSRPSWRDVITTRPSTVSTPPSGRQLSVMVEDNPPEMDPPAYAFASAATLKL